MFNKILFFFTVIAIISLVVPKECSPIVEAKEPYQLREFLNQDFEASSWNGTWISGDSFYYISQLGQIIVYNVEKQTGTVLVELEDLIDAIRNDNHKSGLPKHLRAFKFFSIDIKEQDTPPISSITPSPDLQYLLIGYNQTAVFRHSITSQYKLLKLDTKETYDIADKNFLQLAKWNLVGHSLVYVHQNDLYYLASPEDVHNPRRITSDGIPGQVYNGVSDWVNEEEVLETDSALWFSPDGSSLAFLKFNDTSVKTAEYILYGQPGSLQDQYPTVVGLKYPKAGTTLPTVAVLEVDLTDPDSQAKRHEVLKNLEEAKGSRTDVIIFGVTWPLKGEISVVVTNRVQNKEWVIRCSFQNSTCSKESELFEPNGWIESHTPLYNSDGTRTVNIQPAPEGNDTYYHLIITDLKNNTPTRLTFGERRVTKILHWDESNNLIYYQSTMKDHPAREHSFSVNTVTLEDSCLTCNFSTPSGPCLHGKIDLSKDASYFSKICNGPGPDYIVISNATELNPIVVWEDNGDVLSKLDKKLRPIQKDFIVPIADGYNARVRLYFPPEYDEDSDKKYPAIVKVYGGPDADIISDQYGSDVRDYWVTNRKFIYINIDGRGCGNDGRNKMFEMYRRLGTVEIEDQINVTRYLQENIPGIDANNTGIWGWSYGGFATAWTIAKDSARVFKFGISVAPVTNFLYYDAIYTERYMGLPTSDDNLEGYKNTDVSAKAENFRGRSFLLIHGNGDDNVHYQNSMILAKALEIKDIQFLEMSYPDEQHHLNDVTPHLYHMLDNYIAEQFKQIP